MNVLPPTTSYNNKGHKPIEFPQYALSPDGRALTIFALKNEDGGVYQAEIDYGTGNVDHSFVYEVKISGMLYVPFVMYLKDLFCVMFSLCHVFPACMCLGSCHVVP